MRGAPVWHPLEVILTAGRATSAIRLPDWAQQPTLVGLDRLSVNQVRPLTPCNTLLKRSSGIITAAPLNLANSPSVHLLTPAEQTLCSQLRILPKPYLVIKETLVREYARRGGKLRRREARDLVKIDVNKTSRVWDFLVQAGFLKIAPEPSSAPSTELA